MVTIFKRKIYGLGKDFPLWKYDNLYNLIYLFLFFLLTFILHAFHMRAGISSDSTTMLPAVSEIAQGNIGLKD